jgi:predicted transcriptional regulator
MRADFESKRREIDARILALLDEPRTIASLGFSRSVARKSLARLEEAGLVGHEQRQTGGSLQGALGGWENYYSRK